jgi:transposase
MTTTGQQHSSIDRQPALFVSFELGWSEWKLAFASAPADSPRLRSVKARNTEAVLQEISRAKKRFGLSADASVFCCYEAGRDGFWLHRWLAAQGLNNLVVDSASIETKRRRRRAKNDRLDAAKLVSMLLRYHGGEKKVWSVVHVPSAADEDRRQLHRDLLEQKAERTQHVNRVKGLLASCGLAVTTIGDDFPVVLAALRQWDDTPVPPELQKRLLREWERHQFVERQIRDLENDRARQIRTSAAEPMAQVRKLLNLRGIGANSAWLFTLEFFSWRAIRNRKQLAALAGLTPTPYDSGMSSREQGISKAGNRRLRTMAVEIAWCWLQYQPQSGLSQWYVQRWASGNSRQRRIGIVAVARKLLVALWHYLEKDVVPEGAVTLDWKVKMKSSKRDAVAFT